MQQSRGGDIPWRNYTALTDDGYYLTMFRIVGSLDHKVQERSYQQPKGPLLLIHGFTTDSITWFDRSDENSFAVGTKLFQEGYDVWFANLRGTRRSR